MRETLIIPPPEDYRTFSPSELFRFFFQIGRWTEEGFSADFQTYARGTLISTVTINKWKNRDVIPRRYSGALFRLIEDQFDPNAAKIWIIAFETVWATHIARPNHTAQKTHDSNYSDRICRQHCQWIKSQYEHTINEEIFSASEIYVPLQLIERNDGIKTLYEVEDLLTLISSETERDWTFICGEPGSGKSMIAIHLAQEISKSNIFPIYLRGRHLSDIKIDVQTSDQPVLDSFSFRSFLEHFRASSRKTACLILDGLDEVAIGENHTEHSLQRILLDLCLEQNVCRAHGKKLCIIALGRPSHIDLTSQIIPFQNSSHLEILGLDGREKVSDAAQILGRDLRPEWWKTYLAATKRDIDPILPDFLSTDYDDYSEFGSEPLLTYLICQFALGPHSETTSHRLPHEAVNDLTYAKNKNTIYQAIIKHIHATTALPPGQAIKFKPFLSILQHLALSSWQTGEKRSPSLADVSDSLPNNTTRELFSSLNLAKPEGLFTAFYFRTRAGGAENGETSIEFTHKAFANYLVSTLIFDRFQELIQAFTTNTGLDKALDDWWNISCLGEHEPSLAAFCQNEAQLRYDDFIHLNWDAAFIILSDHLKPAKFDGMGIEAIAYTQSSASLLFFIWSCLNLERYKRTDEQFDLFKDPNGLSSYHLKTLQLPNALNMTGGSRTEPRLQIKTFLTQSLSALKINSADMSQLSFSIGDMQSVNCQNSSFAMTHWSHIKLTDSQFYKASFQHAILHGNRWSESQFSDCLFQATKVQLTSFSKCEFNNVVFSQCHFSDVEFLSLEMKGVIFDRCTFAHCRFDTDDETGEKNEVTFRYCTFLGMKKTLAKMKTQAFESCSFRTSFERDDLNMNESGLEFQLGELLH